MWNNVSSFTICFANNFQMFCKISVVCTFSKWKIIIKNLRIKRRKDKQTKRHLTDSKKIF